MGALLELSPQEIDQRLNEATSFVYLKRQIPPEVAERVSELRIAGLFQNREYRRYYPGGEVMAQVLGFTGVLIASASPWRSVIRPRLALISSTRL